jgi:PAS domain S-box-containing protein
MHSRSGAASSDYLVTEEIIRLLKGNNWVCWEIVNTLPLAVYTTDAAGRLTHYNGAAASLWGRRPAVGEESWCGSWELFQLDGTPIAHHDSPMAVCLKENRPVRGVEAMAVRPDGSKVIFEAYPTPINDEHGRLAGAINVLVDISARTAAEERQAQLLAELNHRVRNTLATVMAISAQTFQSADSPEAFRRAFEGRLLALAQTYNLLNRSCWTGVNLRDIVMDGLAPYAGADGARFVLDGDDLNLGPVTAVTLGMAFHELITNAAKYGALSVPCGRVQVAWRTCAPCRLHLEWQEMDGPPVSQPRRRGYGSRLIEWPLASALGGEVRLDFLTDGVRCSMDMALDRVSVH